MMAQRRQRRCDRCKQPHRNEGGLCEACSVWASERYDKQRGTPSQRGYKGQWPKVRARKLEQEPLCERCKAEGMTVAAVTVHHIKEIEGRDDPNRLRWDNLESLCFDCHETHHGRRGKVNTP
jgi:5-methylcytosine-specific restriction protein A